MNTEKRGVPSLAEALLRGAFWTVAARWMSRFLGIISLAICARILTPSDYGLVNMAMVAVGFSNILVEFGIDSALIRNQQANHLHYDTAWSLRILQCMTLSLLIVLSSSFAAHFYKDDRVIPIMLAVAAAGFFGGFQNIYAVNLRKNLDFGRDFLFNFIPRLVSSILTIIFVISFKSYWGLVIGICATELSRLACSYILVRERARWGLSKWRELTGFSVWYFLRGFSDFITFQFDRFLIGMLGGAKQVGIYGTAREIAALPATELVDPISRALIPTLSKLNDFPARQSAAITKSLAGTMLIAAPVSIGFATVAHEFVLLMFGDKWTAVVPLIPVICISGMSAGFRTTALNILIVVGSVRVAAILGWIQTALSMLAFYPSYLAGGLQGITIAYAGVSIVMVALQGVHMHKLRLLRGPSLWKAICRPILASALMYGLIEFLAPMLPKDILLAMMCKIAIGGTTYVVLVLLLWRLMGGGDDSSERQLIDMLMKRLPRKIFARSSSDSTRKFQDIQS